MNTTTTKNIYISRKRNTYPMSKSLRDIGGCQSPKAKPQTMEGNGGRNSEEKKMPLTSSPCDGGNKKGGEGERGGTMTS